MRESEMWRSVRQGLLKASCNKIYLQRVENLLSAGTPDVNYIYGNKSGWIELKYIPDYPKKKNTFINIAHLTLVQKKILENIAKAGDGKNITAWLLIRIKKDYFLINGIKMPAMTDLTREKLIYLADFARIKTPLNYAELLTFL